MKMITVDAVVPVEVDKDKYADELATLSTMLVGLNRITGYVARREQEWKAAYPNIEMSVFGRDVGAKGDLQFTACMFHWFGVTLCNYVRLVGFIKALEGSSQEQREFARGNRPASKQLARSITKYVQSLPEISSILTWRRMVAGHFITTDLQPTDNISMDASIIYPVVYSQGRYRVTEFDSAVRDDEAEDESDLIGWSVTEIYEQLAPRYWPQPVTPSG